MTLLFEIQSALLNNEALGPILLKLRFLAAKLGSKPLEDWIKHETTGYSDKKSLPEYRQIGISYKGNFYGAFGASVQNTPIPPFAIYTFAGDNWLTHSVFQSITGIESLIETAKESSGILAINSNDLIYVLQGKIYPQYSCTSITGMISSSSLIEIQNIVRNKILELTVTLENSIPEIAHFSLGQQPITQKPDELEKITAIYQQVVHGNLISISSNGDGANFAFNTHAGDKASVRQALEMAGIATSDAKDFSDILSKEKAEDKSEPFGAEAKKWISKNIGKAADGTWKVGIAIATQVLTEAALKYYGLK